jgi:hypothetical protein
MYINTFKGLTTNHHGCTISLRFLFEIKKPGFVHITNKEIDGYFDKMQKYHKLSFKATMIILLSGCSPHGSVFVGQKLIYNICIPL